MPLTKAQRDESYAKAKKATEKKMRDKSYAKAKKATEKKMGDKSYSKAKKATEKKMGDKSLDKKKASRKKLLKRGSDLAGRLGGALLSTATPLAGPALKGLDLRVLRKKAPKKPLKKARAIGRKA